MIYATVNLTIGKNETTSDSMIVLYRGDKNVEIRFVMKGNKFTVLENTYAQLIIRRPSASSIFSDVSLISNDTVVLTITGEMIDEMKEIGEYTFQIRLYDDKRNSRVTLPPCYGSLCIERPIAIEGEAMVNYARINDDIIAYSDDELDLDDVFTDDIYNKTIWNDGDLITEFNMNKIEEALYMLSGRESGSGSGSMVYISTTLAESFLVKTGESFELPIDYYSPNMGEGTLKVFVNDEEIISKKIPQGESITEVTSEKFKKGNNTVNVYVIDRRGDMSNNLVFSVRYGGTEISSDFNPYTTYDYGSVIRYYFTPTTLDTSMKLTFYMSIDGVVQEGVECTSDTRGYYTFPNNLSADSHYCEAYIIDGEGSKSNVLAFNLIIIKDNTLIVASDVRELIIEEGEQISLDYKVYMNDNDTFITKLYIDSKLVNTGTCGLDFNYYRTSSLTEGIHSIKLEVYDYTETYSDYIYWTITVTESSFEMLKPVNAGAMFIGTAVNRTNADERKESFIGYDQDNTEIAAMMYNFAYNAENGWVDDELIISGESYVEIPVQPLSNNAKYGFTLDVDFTSKMIGVEDAEVLTLWDDEKNCGIKITTERLILRSAEGNECKLYFTDNERTNVIFVIDRNEVKAKIYLNGVMCNAFHLSDYEIDGVAYLEDFTVNSNIILGGRGKGGYCKINNIRVYQVALTTDEIINNWISCNTVKSVQKELIEFQNGDHLPTMMIYCDFSGLGKDDKKPCRIVYTSTDDEKYGKSFILDHKESKLQYQGTSSMAYPIKNYRINLRDKDGEKWYYDFPYGKPECRFTLKADFMSSGHWTNTGLAKWVNDNLYNYNKNDESSMNPKKWYDIKHGGEINDTRECIYGFPCRLILVNDGDTALNEGQNEPTPGNTKDMGIFNFNHDKDCADTIGLDQDVFPNCASFEVTANSDTSAGAFMSFTKEYSLIATTKPTNIYYSSAAFNFEDYFTPPYVITDAKYVFKIKSTTNGDLYTIPKNSNVTINELPIVYIQAYDTTRGSDTLEFKINGSIVRMDRYSGAVMEVILGDEDELNYITESFELRFPDEEDVPKGWGYLGIEGEAGTGLKALIDWVDTCTDEEFVRDFDQHFNRDYTLRYYLLVITLGMVDNLGKNMMLDTWDNKIFMPRFYDMDTICSYDNSGQLKFDVDIEMEQGYWNTSSSRLWTRIRDLMHDELVVKYNNMRQYGLSYESLMKYFYDDQIAKIPQKYYNMDYDVKYAPFADSYIGMANGNVYEHLKRWLTQRLRFVDTLFDYAPSYNNDVLTIRANTTEPMTLYIETYTPVYQHLSWYNNQMDKKKIDGKIAVSFTGTAMAATDQEVLIYGGSNIKKISGISSMNPNRMLIGSATRLIELDASNCPLLSDINSNKANLAPHEYLNNLNLSNCPLLEGNLRVNKSPLLRNIDIRNTGITGLFLPSSLRNLETIKLPSTITSLSFNDAASLTNIEFDNQPVLSEINISNCPKLTNMINCDFSDIPIIKLDNSMNNYAELYFRNTTDLTIRNMSNLERVIYEPNAESESFNRDNLYNANNYKVTTYNSPNLSTFMTTAPYRDSYNNCEMDENGLKIYPDKNPNAVFMANEIDLTNTQFTDVELLCTTDANTLKLPNTVEDVIVDSAYDLDEVYLVDGSYDNIHTTLYTPYQTDYPNEIYITNRNFIPSASDGSLIYTIQTPNTDQPQEGVWDFSGLSLDKLHVFGLNNDIVINENTGAISMPNRTDNYTNTIQNTIFDDLAARYVSSDYTACPTFDEGFEYEHYTYAIDDENFEHVIIYSQEPPNHVSFSDMTTLIRVEYINIKNITNMSAMFAGCNKLTSLDLSNFDTTNVTNMSYMFYNCSALSSLDLSNFDTKNVTNMGSMFQGCNALTSLDLSNFDTKNVTNMGSMFQICKTLTSLDVSNFDTTNVTSMQSMFAGCNKLTSLDLSNFDTKNVTDMGSMFQGCNALTSLDVSNFDTKNVTNMSGMFQICKTLTSLDVSNFDTTNVTSMQSMFQGCNTLTSLDVSNFDTTKVTTMSAMFRECNALTSLDLSNFDTKNVRNMGSMFNGCRDLTSLDLSNFDTTNVGNMGSMFNICNALTTLTANNMTHANPKLFTDAINNGIINELIAKNWKFNGENVILNELFRDNTTLQKLDLSDWDTTNVTSMQNMFYNCSALSSLDVSNFDTTNVTNMANMFYNCNALTSLDVSNFDTTNVTNMAYMFYGCKTLTSLDLSNFDTTNVTSMNSMFYNCNALTSLDVSNFDTTNVTNMYAMFYGCKTLTSLDVSNFDTTNVTNMQSMFQGCNALTSLDVSNFDTTNVKNMYAMFYDCNALMTLNVVGWPLNEYTQTAISSLPTGDDAKNEIYATVYFSVPSGWSIINPLDFLIYTTNASGVMPTFNAEFSGYSVNETDNGDGTYRVKIATDNLSNLPTLISFNGKVKLLTVEMINTSEIINMANMFNGCNALTSLDLSNFDTTNVRNMQNMFYNCSALSSLDVSNFDTTNVTNMSSMFHSCNALTSLDVSNFDTTNVMSMAHMFRDCYALTSLDVSNFDTKNVKSMDYMFKGCNKLTSLDLSNFDTTNVTSMSYMFYNCNALTSLNLSNFDTTNVTNMTGMFYNCYALTSLDVSNFDIKNVRDMGNMFRDCSALTSLDVSNFDTKNVKSMSNMFRDCNALTTLNVEGWPLNDITQTAISSLPVGDDERNDIYAFVYFSVPSGWNLINAYEIAKYTCNASGVLPAFNSDYTGYSTTEADNGDGTYATRIMTNDLDVMPSSISFYGTTSLLSVEYLKVTSSVTNMYAMFNGCSALTSLDVSGFDTSSVTNMWGMFAFCNALTSLDVSNFDTSKVTDMGGMFAGCNALTSLDVSNFDTSSVTNMYAMFNGCSALTSLDVSGFDTSSVTNMWGMFYDCYALTSLDLSDFNTSSVTDMNAMFYNCIALTSLDSMQNISTDLALNNTKLDVTSLIDVINNLASISSAQTLTLGLTLLAKLTEEQIAIAMNKGWSVA